MTNPLFGIRPAAPRPAACTPAVALSWKRLPSNCDSKCETFCIL